MAANKCRERRTSVSVKVLMEKQSSSAYSADVLDPFVLRQTLTPLQWIQTSVHTVIFLPLRLLLILCVLLVTWLLGTVLLLGTPLEEMRGVVPLAGWRRNRAKPLIANLASLMFWIGGWRWTVKGERAPAGDAPLLLLGPHSSFLDTAAVVALGCPGMVVKDTTAHAPLFGSLIRYQQPVLVQSEAADSRQQAAEEIRRRARSGDEWEQLLIFPEGGCGNRKAFLHFKLGAFFPGVPVQPVVLRYRNKLDTISWTWDGPGALNQLWLTLTQFRIYGELEFLPVYTPTDFERSNPRKFADNVQRYMSKYSGTPISRFSVEDAKFLNVARKFSFPPTVAVCKLLRARKSIGRESLDPAVELEQLCVKKYSSLEGGDSAMAAYLGLEKCPRALQDFYSFMDQHSKKSMDFRLYAVGLCLIRTDLKPKEKLKAAFEAFGCNNDADHLALVLFMWKGIPTTISTLKKLSHHDEIKNEEVDNRCS